MWQKRLPLKKWVFLHLAVVVVVVVAVVAVVDVVAAADTVKLGYKTILNM